MKRFEQKVRDIVEVRASAGLDDFLVDPAGTLSGYHFTDITSDLMSKWLDRIADVKKGSGVALALAGFRGVGKSHFLAALGAIVSKPELRSGISDSHIAASAQRLSRRHGVVAHVQRGTRATLIEELKEAIAHITGLTSIELGDSVNELVIASWAKSGDLPPVIFIDTAVGREKRVARDDGRMLSEIAAAAVEMGVFVGIALDDDIAGADGINSSIASSFEIDYLDQEHLYKIVNAHVFAKNEQTWPVLHDIYESYRRSMPGFRWSESRFTSLYPLHPAILEIAPFVRLYLHDFALLGFASEAGVKILGRPANSLIGLDEVFDSIEDRLRNVTDLKTAFEAFDLLDKTVVAKGPVMQRHEAKLILKGLFLLSMTGNGVAASDLAAAMMIFDDQDPAAATAKVETALGTFATALPDSIKVSSGSGAPKYLLKVDSEDDVSTALSNAIAAVSADVVWPILRRQTAEKFADLTPYEHDPSVSAKCTVVWRGSIRRGEIMWSGEADNDANRSDWRLFVVSEAAGEAYFSGPHDDAGWVWRLGPLNADDIDTLRRFHVLQTDVGFREKFRESISTALHVHLIAIEKIWQRVFLEDGYLIADKIEYRFSEEAGGSHSLAQLFTIALADHFAAQFPAHPEFGDVLYEQHVSQLVENLFSGAAPGGKEVQKLAADLAFPLGLVTENDGVYSPLAATELIELPLVKAILADVPTEKNGVIGIKELSARMQQLPYGLTREAQQLVLAALIAQRQFEFVTSSGNRINHRSLDLQIVWDDIVGIAQTAEEIYSNERLVKWAAILTGNASLKSLKTADSRDAAIEALSAWLTEWRSAAVLEWFDRLPDDKLNTRLWRIGAGVKKTFGRAADAVDGLLKDPANLDQFLQAIADAFWDSDDEYSAKSNDLIVLRGLMDLAVQNQEIGEYLLLCELTGDVEIDGLRARLLDNLASQFDGKEREDVRPEWERFREMYADWYATHHKAIMNVAADKVDRFFASTLWATFADLSSTLWFDGPESERAKAVVRKVRSLRCTADVRDALTRHPHCICSFSLPDARDADILIGEVTSSVVAALEHFRHRLTDQKDALPAGIGITGMTAESLLTLSGAGMQALKIAVRQLPPHRAASDAGNIRDIEKKLDR